MCTSTEGSILCGEGVKMEGLVRFATRAGVVAVGAGIISELCLYDGLMLIFSPLGLTYFSVLQLMEEEEP
jgi:hypothetical protein